MPILHELGLLPPAQRLAFLTNHNFSPLVDLTEDEEVAEFLSLLLQVPQASEQEYLFSEIVERYGVLDSALWLPPDGALLPLLARTLLRVDRPFDACVMAGIALARGAAAEAWRHLMDGPYYQHFFQTPLMNQAWRATPEGATLARPQHSGPTRRFYLPTGSRLMLEGCPLSVLRTDGQVTFHLLPEDEVFLQQACDSDGSHQTAALSPGEAVATVLLKGRAPLLERFVKALLAAVGVALVEQSAEPVRALLQEPEFAPAVVWFPQSVVPPLGKVDPAGWIEVGLPPDLSADAAALRGCAPAGVALTLAEPERLMGIPAATLHVRNGTYSLQLSFDGQGACTLIAEALTGEV